ncbi:MAG: hypothetical protein ACOCWC_04875 [Bacteroidota bacterium]
MTKSKVIQNVTVVNNDGLLEFHHQMKYKSFKKWKRNDSVWRELFQFLVETNYYN